MACIPSCRSGPSFEPANTLANSLVERPRESAQRDPAQHKQPGPPLVVLDENRWVAWPFECRGRARRWSRGDRDGVMDQKRFDELLLKHQVPGATLAVLAGDDVSALASGVLNLATGVEATTDSLFQGWGRAARSARRRPS